MLEGGGEGNVRCTSKEEVKVKPDVNSRRRRRERRWL